MTSRSATVLVVALPLGLCLFVSLSITVILSIRLRHRRYYKRNWLKLKVRIQERQEKLDTFARLLDHNNTEDCGTSNDVLGTSYRNTYHGLATPLQKYIEKWFSYDKIQPPIPDEITRLENVLFPPSPLIIPLSIDRDVSIYSNPQQYRTAEIATILHSSRRSYMIQHIMVSTLLKNTYMKGNPCLSLLPLLPDDIDGLCNLSDAFRNGLQLHRRLSVHMHRFGFYRSIPERGNYVQEPYHTFFETIFQPYFKSNSPEDVVERRTDLSEVFNAAVAHGMECLTTVGEIDYRWGEKDDSTIVTVPAMTVTRGIDGHTEVLCESLSLP